MSAQGADELGSPSGRQLHLTHDQQEVVITEVGAGIRSYTMAGEHVLDGYGPAEMCSSARGQTLLPWPNRIDRGTYRFGGYEHQLALTEPAKQTAIHGLTRFANWQTAGHTSCDAALTHRLHPQPGYPFLLDLRLDYHLDARGLSVTTSAVNSGNQACPFGAGAHPYLTIGRGTIDGLVLTSPAEEVLIADQRGIPLRTAPIGGTPGDFRHPRAIGPTTLDTAFTALLRSADGRARVILSSSEDERRVELWMDEHYPFLMLFTADTVAKDRRRQGLGIEPMTCAPNAFRSGDGLIVLEPGDTFSGTWGIHPTGFPAQGPTPGKEELGRSASE